MHLLQSFQKSRHLKGKRMMNKIDIVITWVDGNDPNWQAEKAKYQEKKSGDVRASRYREWGFLRYWFRSIEKNAPWVRYIYFVTWGHLPEWLDTSNPKLKIVKHTDFIPEQYLPTFSCRPIEFNLHRIEGLSEEFVYFNDDMYLLQPTTENDFFVNGLPCDVGIVDATIVNGETNDGDHVAAQNLYTSLIYNLMVINRNFDKQQSIKNNRAKWYSLKYGTTLIKTLLLTPWKKFTGFYTIHCPYSYLKSTFDEVWEKEPELLESACIHKFRNSQDVSSRVLSFWQIAKGTFYPRSPKVGVARNISSDDSNNQKICNEIRMAAHKMMCINDDYHGDEFKRVQEKYISAFETLFPERSSFEKDI